MNQIPQAGEIYQHLKRRAGQDQAEVQQGSRRMLQQTRVEAVKPYFARFMERLPDIEALAEVDDDELLKLWEGLGYYSRARNLKAAAQQIVTEYGGEMPSDYRELLKRAKYGFTASTRVCCSMISDTQTRYGVGSSRQGKLRLLLSYHVNSPGAIRFNSSCFLCTSIFLGVCCFNPVLRFFLFCSPQAIALITLQCHQAAFQRVVLLLQAALRKLQIQGSSKPQEKIGRAHV